MRIISAECNYWFHTRTATVLFIVAVLDFARTVADGSYMLSLFYALLTVPIVSTVPTVTTVSNVSTAYLMSCMHYCAYNVYCIPNVLYLTVRLTIMSLLYHSLSTTVYLLYISIMS